MTAHFEQNEGLYERYTSKEIVCGDKALPFQILALFYYQGIGIMP